jgi:gamma-glutamyltranspeptidase/glutathione hydrolase
MIASGGRAAVAAPHADAARAGAEVLARGGSAVDAAIAMNAVLCVAYPHMAGLGGDGFWLVRERRGRVAAINASGPAAALATREAYRAEHPDGIPLRGPRAALTVPGAVDGWRLAHERWGRLSWPELFGPAIALARDGFPVPPSLARYVVRDAADLHAHPAAGTLFAGLLPGRTLVQPHLARSLEVLARRGARAGLYEGPLGAEMARALETGGSPLRLDDLAAYHAEWIAPLRADYRGHELLELPPNTQGFAAIEILRLLEGYDLVAMGDESADYVHAAVEATRLAFADRDAWLADPARVTAPLDLLTSRAYAAQRRPLIDPGHARPRDPVGPGIPFDSAARRPALGAQSTRGTPPGPPPSPPLANPPFPGGDTCYLCALDAEGLAVSCIQSIFHAFGSMALGGDTGILLQNRGTSFSLDDDAAARLEPGARPPHTLIPAMLLRDGSPVLLFGAMGGEGQPQTHAALVTRVVDFGRDAAQAVAAPRWLAGRAWGAGTSGLALESRFPPEVVRELERRGHAVRIVAAHDELMGHAQAILVRDGALEAAADPRGDGAGIVL